MKTHSFFVGTVLFLVPFLALAQVPGGTQGLVLKKNLNDHEQFTVDNYYHEGKAKEILKTECQKPENKAACTDDEAYVFGSTGDMTVQAAGKMYSLFAGANLIGGGSTPEGGKDFCQAIPLATETAATSYQTISQKDIGTPLGTEPAASPVPGATPATVNHNKQRDSIEALKKSHSTRETTAIIQTAGWGAGAGCYGVMMATGKMVPTKMNVLKAAAATGLAGFYGVKWQKQKKFEKRLDDILAKMPKAGECNPVTEKNCYCNQESTKNDPKYCLPEIYAKRRMEGLTVVSCVDNELKADPECRCLETSTCFEKTFKDLSVVGNFDSLSNGGLIKDAADINKGLLNSGSVKANTPSTLAFGKKVLDDNASLLSKENLNLTPDQEKEAEYMESLGVPKPYSQYFASRPSDPSTASKFKDDLLGSNDVAYYPRGNIGNENTRVLYYDGKGLGPKRSVSSSTLNQFTIPSLEKKAADPKLQILEFARDAQNKAEINTNKNLGIFEIISRRYKVHYGSAPTK